MIVEVRDEVRTDVVVDAEVFVVDIFEVVADAEEAAVVITEGILLEVVSVGTAPVSVVDEAAAEEVVYKTEVPVVRFAFGSVCVLAVEDDAIVPDEVVCTV